MTVKIITDSTSDISAEMAKDLGIDVVPGYVCFGKDTYRDNVELSKSGFYKMLLESPFHPITSEATPQDFAEVYSRCADEADGIVSIHISAKLSRIISSAQKGKKMAKVKCDIEIVDSHFASIGLGLIVIAAARLAKAGEHIQNIIKETRRAVDQISMLGLLDTMKYVARGGRANKNVIALSNVFHIKPILTFRSGEVTIDGLVRTYPHGIDKLCKFIERVPAIQDLGIAYSTSYEQAMKIIQQLDIAFPKQNIYVEQIGATLGAHTGPDAIVVALR